MRSAATWGYMYHYKVHYVSKVIVTWYDQETQIHIFRQNLLTYNVIQKQVLLQCTDVCIRAIVNALPMYRLYTLMDIN